MNIKKKKKTLCWVYKVSENTSATRFNLLLTYPTVPPFVYAALFVPSFQKFEQLFFFGFPRFGGSFQLYVHSSFLYIIFSVL